MPHLDWLALPDHCFTAAETAKRTQKQVCPHAPRSGAKCCGRNACAEVRGVLSCTLEWPERSARGRPKLRKFEARALVQLLVAWEQSSVDAIAFSASLTGENLPAAAVVPRKKVRLYDGHSHFGVKLVTRQLSLVYYFDKSTPPFQSTRHNVLTPPFRLITQSDHRH